MVERLLKIITNHFLKQELFGLWYRMSGIQIPSATPLNFLESSPLTLEGMLIMV
jgi:hypothetical protein